MSSEPSLSTKPSQGGPVASPVTEKVIPGDLNESASDGTKYKSSIAILPSSLPEYHRAYMKKFEESRAKETESGDEQPEGQLREQTEEEQASTAKNLKPQSRSQLNADKANAKPESLTPLPSKKPRQLRWQFGIRSRNPPLDAMLCLYRALAKSGAEWEEPNTDEDSYHGSIDVGDNMTEAQWSGEGSNSDAKSERPNPVRATNHPQQVYSEVGPYEHAIESSSGSTDSDDFNIPEDPWIIRCRWLKEGLGPAGSLANSSNRSSKGNLAAIESAMRAAGEAAGNQTNDGGNTNPTGPHSASGSMTAVGDINDKIYVYADVQLYQIERDFYMVDFKCAGYERVVEVAVDVDTSSEEAAGAEGGAMDSGQTGKTTSGNQQPSREGDKKSRRKVKRRLGRRFRPEEKKVSSPFPFLGIASKLIIALAEGD